MAKLEFKLSVMDCGTVSDLIEIICGYPKEKLPDDLRAQLEQWVKNNTSEDD